MWKTRGCYKQRLEREGGQSTCNWTKLERERRYRQVSPGTPSAQGKGSGWVFSVGSTDIGER